MIRQLVRTFWQDIRYGARLLTKSPGFTLIAALTLALGLGANLTLFSWLDNLVYAGVPGAREPQRLVIAQCSSPNFSEMAISYPNYKDYRDRARTVSGLLACSFLPVNLTESSQPERIWGEIVSGNYFDVLGVRLELGRGFLPEEDRTPGTHPVVVISHGLWQQRFGGDRGVIGRTIQINNRPFTIVGVAPKTFQGSWMGLRFALWAPIMMQPVLSEGEGFLQMRGTCWLTVMGRLAPGASMTQAKAEFKALAAQLEQEYPNINGQITATVHELKDSPEGAQKIMGPVLKTLLMLTGLVLLAACTNVANLILVRASARQRELAVRLSMGATRGRIVRQLISEQMLLFLMGGLVSLLFLLWSDRLMAFFADFVDFPVSFEFGLSTRVVGFCGLLVLVMGGLFSLIPALQASKMNLSTVLKEEGSAVTGNRRRARLRSVLVVAQLTLAMILLISAGLFVHSMLKVGSQDVGLQPRGVLLASMDLFSSAYTPERGVQFHRQLLDRVRALPGVQFASLAASIPLGMGGGNSSSMEVEGYTPRKDETPSTNTNWAQSDFLKAMGIRLVQGREFTDRDDGRAPQVVMVNEALARAYYAGRSPLGKRIRIGGGEWREIVGVTQDFRFRSLDEPVEPMAITPLAQDYRGEVTLVLRTAGEPTRLTAAMRDAVRGLNPRLPLYMVRTMEKHMETATIAQRMAAIMLSALGLLVLLITVVGLYGVLSQAAVQRTREMGIRSAFGASPARILGTIARHGLALLLIGLVLGVAGALACARLFASLLIGVSPHDPLVFVGVPALLAGIALTACLLPARRAARLWPSLALRHE